MREIKKIIIHCSDSLWGDREIIDEWHEERGFKSPSGVHIGYHYVILNAYPTRESYKENYPVLGVDGEKQEGRKEDEMSAHCKGENPNSIGICLIGRDTFTSAQLYNLLDLLSDLLDKHDLSIEDVYGHRDFNANKDCPEISTKWIRDYLESYIES